MKCHILTFGKRSEKMNRESTTASKINQKHTQLTLKKRAAQHRRPASAAVTVPAGIAHKKNFLLHSSLRPAIRAYYNS